MIPDKINCTYWWKINLDQQHPQNNPNVKFMLGYSKFQNQAENVDKITCLCRKIEMLTKHGYLKRSRNIVIYEKITPLPDAQRDRAIIILRANDYEINPELIGIINKDILIFLKKLYTVINTGKPIENLIPLPANKVLKDEIFYKFNGQFKTVHALTEWCEKQTASGENRQRVISFYREYILKYFSELTPIIKL